MCSNFDRRNYIKKLLKGKGRNVKEQRADRRQRLVEKFKLLRIQSVDNLRNLKDNELTMELLYELKNQILSTLDQRDLLNEENINMFLEDLEEEMKIIEYEQQNIEYEKICTEEIESITKNLMNKCDICEDLTMQNGICEPCLQAHFTSQL